MPANLSIIIPVYNTAIYLDRCINSLVPQIKDNVEIILVDDGSTDGSGQICDLIERKHSFIKTLHKENGGLASARNAGLETAKGKYVSFLDSDDWLDVETIEEVLKTIAEFDPDIIGFGCKRTTGESVYEKIYQPWQTGMIGEMPKIRADMINDPHLFNFGVIRSSCMHVFRKKIIDDYSLRFTSERIVLNEDFLFMIGFIMHAESYYNLGQPFYNYYTREGSLTQKYLTDMYKRKKELLSRYKKAIKNDPLGEYEYRTSLFFLDSCYECLANECSSENPSKAIITEILSDIKKSNVIKKVNRAEQSAKARVVLSVMSLNNAAIYIAYYRLFKILKKLKKEGSKTKGKH